MLFKWYISKNIIFYKYQSILILFQQKSKRKKDKESGVSRGIDFQHVSNVINFDFPLDVNSYVHRAGRTARGNNQVNYWHILLMLNASVYEWMDCKSMSPKWLNSIKFYVKPASQGRKLLNLLFEYQFQSQMFMVPGFSTIVCITSRENSNGFSWRTFI